VLYALANTAGEFFESVSTLAIRHALARRASEGPLSDLLDELVSVRDVQRLKGGYWLPCETNVVAVSRIGILASGMPTFLLRSIVKTSIFGEGSARLIVLADESPPPNSLQSFSSWCRAPTDTLAWAENAVKSARFDAPLGSRSLEVFNHWDRKVDTRWAKESGKRLPGEGVFLARELGPTGRRYSLMRSDMKRTITVADFGGDGNVARRMAFALRARAGNPLTYSTRLIKPEFVHATVPVFIPSEEKSALRALGAVTAIANTSLMTAEVPAEAWPQVESMVDSLGLKAW
jgi:hypothetical protein